MTSSSYAPKFPLRQTPEVRKELKRLIKSRKHLRSCFKRMEKYRPMISKQLSHHKLPQELLAIPIVESCYQNIHSKNGWGSGIWMFVKGTAKGYGLKVNAKVDQRLDVKKSTEAALKYIKANHRIFNNWELTLLAYNMGENKVLKAMQKTKSKNAWVLVRKGHENDKGYLAKMIATIIIMKNPTDYLP